MRYDFDNPPDRRNTLCNKWDRVADLFGNPDALPMWVADTDFPCPEPVMEALRARLEHPIFGYHYPPDSLYEAIVDRMWEHHGWRIRPEWVVLGPGVISDLRSALGAVSRPGDEIVLQPPVYYPFAAAVGDEGRRVVENPLLLEDGRYRMDFPGLESLFEVVTSFPARDPRISAVVLCSPHNPVGRVWERGELGRLGQICLRQNAVLISDEIHCDLVVGDGAHVPAASISAELARNTITLMSANKTYNTPGLKTSFAIIPDEDIRRRFGFAGRARGGVNCLGLAALEAAMRDPDDYLEQLLEYLRGNIRVFREGIADLDGVKLVEPEGTYLLWLDMRGLGLDDHALARFVVDEIGIAPDYGYVFGTGGGGFQRINVGCPRSMVVEAVSRLRGALRAR